MRHIKLVRHKVSHVGSVLSSSLSMHHAGPLAQCSGHPGWENAATAFLPVLESICHTSKRIVGHDFSSPHGCKSEKLTNWVGKARYELRKVYMPAGSVLPCSASSSLAVCHFKSTVLTSTGVLSGSVQTMRTPRPVMNGNSSTIELMKSDVA